MVLREIAIDHVPRPLSSTPGTKFPVKESRRPGSPVRHAQRLLLAVGDPEDLLFLRIRPQVATCGQAQPLGRSHRRRSRSMRLSSWSCALRPRVSSSRHWSCSLSRVASSSRDGRVLTNVRYPGLLVHTTRPADGNALMTFLGFFSLMATVPLGILVWWSMAILFHDPMFRIGAGRIVTTG